MRIFFHKLIIFLFVLSISLTATADVINSYRFTSPLQEQRFVKLISELRCVVCQNQSLAESNAPLAQDLKKQVYEQLQAGFTDDQIKNYLVQRYGEYILFKPSLNRITFILWLGPLIFLVGSFCILLISMRQNRNIAVDNSIEQGRQI